MAKKVIPQRKRLAAIFASFAILIMGTTSLMQSMSIDYYSVINTLEKIIPASIALGALGWVMGMILDRPKRNKKIRTQNLLLNKMIKTEAPPIVEESDTANKEESKG